eukprot:scaffold22565_cov97-Cylindrotheca_fusiformis.AAC.2
MTSKLMVKDSWYSGPKKSKGRKGNGGMRIHQPGEGETSKVTFTVSQSHYFVHSLPTASAKKDSNNKKAY